MSESLQNVQQLTGAALAAEVAERVMGWETFLHQGVPIYTPRGGNSSKVVRADTFRPDLKIEQAIEVVQRMIELNWNFSLEWEPSHGERPIAGFYRHAARDADDAMYVAGDTIPEAICKAALKAVNTP